MDWCAVSEESVTGLYFLKNESVTRDSYKRILRYILIPGLRYSPQDPIFQKDEAPPHCAHIVATTLIKNAEPVALAKMDIARVHRALQTLAQ